MCNIDSYLNQIIFRHLRLRRISLTGSASIGNTEYIENMKISKMQTEANASFIFFNSTFHSPFNYSTKLQEAPATQKLRKPIQSCGLLH